MTRPSSSPACLGLAILVAVTAPLAAQVTATQGSAPPPPPPAVRQFETTFSSPMVLTFPMPVLLPLASTSIQGVSKYSCDGTYFSTLTVASRTKATKLDLTATIAVLADYHDKDVDLLAEIVAAGRVVAASDHWRGQVEEGKARPVVVRLRPRESRCSENLPQTRWKITTPLRSRCAAESLAAARRRAPTYAVGRGRLTRP